MKEKITKTNVPSYPELTPGQLATKLINEGFVTSSKIAAMRSTDSVPFNTQKNWSKPRP